MASCHVELILCKKKDAPWFSLLCLEDFSKFSDISNLLLIQIWWNPVQPTIYNQIQIKLTTDRTDSHGRFMALQR